jgi:hypothetical protein
LLSRVFVGGKDEDDDQSPPPSTTVSAPVGPGNGLLDPAHVSFLRALSDKATWPRVELGRLAADNGLMLGGAIETLNEASFALCDQPLLEEDDPVDINPDALGRMLQHVG